MLVPTEFYKMRFENNELLRISTVDRDDCQRRYIGTKFEFSLADNLISLSNIFCYHQFNENYNNSKFEADLLVICPSNYLLLVEAKAYKGNYDLAKNKRYFVKNGIEVKNPIIQIKRISSLLRNFLKSKGFNFNIIPLVVFADGLFISNEIIEIFSKSNVQLLGVEHFLPFVSKYASGVFEKTSQSSELVKAFYTDLGQHPILFDDAVFAKSQTGGSHASL